MQRPSSEPTTADDDTVHCSITGRSGTVSVSSSSAAVNGELKMSSEQFDSLRREATKLERILEEKLAKYQQVCHVIPLGFFGVWIENEMD